jgi:hypothetical protein
MNSDKFTWTTDAENHLVWFDMEVILNYLSYFSMFVKTPYGKIYGNLMTTSEQIQGLVLQTE